MKIIPWNPLSVSEVLNGRIGAMVLAGVLLALCFPPYHFVVLLPLPFAILGVALPGAGRWELVRATSVFGFVFYLLHVYWFVNFHPMAFPGVLIVLTVYFAIWGYVLSWAGVNAWSISGGWMLTQLITGGGYLAFPWSRLATALAIDPSFVQAVRWTGELAFGGLIVFVGCTLGSSLKKRSLNSKFVVSLTLLVLLIAAGAYRMHAIDLATYDRDVLLVQPDVMSTFDAADQSGNQLVNLRELTTNNAREGDLVVWPETALIQFPLQFGADGTSLEYRDYLHRRRIESYVEPGVHLLSGIRFYDPRPNRLDYLNGGVLFNPEGEPAGYYLKRIMVPFGESIPGMGQYEIIESFGRMVGTLGYRSGRKGGLIDVPVGGSFVSTAIQICYEDVFPSYVHGQVRKGADLLVNISNDSWSRSSAAHWQHFYRARLRAIETGRSLLRNGNTGVSAVIDPLGRTEDRLDPFEKGVVRAQPFKPLKMSYIVKWNSWITYATMLLFLGIGWTVKRDEKERTNN